MIVENIKDFANKIGGEISITLSRETWEKFKTEIQETTNGKEVGHPFSLVKNKCYSVRVSCEGEK